jgi:hypothetical protein
MRTLPKLGKGPENILKGTYFRAGGTEWGVTISMLESPCPRLSFRPSIAPWTRVLGPTAQLLKSGNPTEIETHICSDVFFLSMGFG